MKGVCNKKVNRLFDVLAYREGAFVEAAHGVNFMAIQRKLVFRNVGLIGDIINNDRFLYLFHHIMMQ